MLGALLAMRGAGNIGEDAGMLVGMPPLSGAILTGYAVVLEGGAK